MQKEEIRPWENRTSKQVDYAAMSIEDAVFIYDWVREDFPQEELTASLPYSSQTINFLVEQIRKDVRAAQAYQSGERKQPRDWFFRKIVRPYVLERDEYTCANPVCDMDDKTHRETYPTGLHVHHINDNHLDNDPRNLATVCIPCHQKTNVTQLSGALNKTLQEIVAQRENKEMYAQAHIA